MKDELTQARKRLQAVTDEAFPNHRRSVPRPGSGRRKEIDYNKVRELTAQGQTAAAIAQALHCSVSSINQIRCKLGITNPTHWMTEERKQRIEQMLDDGWSFAEITRTDGADFETLKRHFPGRQWTQEQQTEYLRTLRIGRGYNYNGARRAA